jgi:tetratricopeptide (TPR) repeat protein
MTGALRWHVRDQYAMRWAALGNLDLSLWLVNEDERVARADQNQQAYLNALGTRVRLLDIVGQSDSAVQASKAYLAARESEKPTASWLSAVAMHAEMLTGAGEFDAAKASVDRLLEACPDGCNGDLNLLLAGVFWSLPEEESEYRSELLAELVRMAKQGQTERLAGVRLYQGIMKLGDEAFDDALIDFLEAERLFTEANDPSGVARAKFYNFVAQLRRNEPQKAFETALESLKATRELRDFDSAARTYEALTGLYRNLDPNAQPGPYLAAAKDVMLAAVNTQLARGDFSGASGSLFSLGVFLVRVGQLDEAKRVLLQSVVFGIRSTNFEVVALSHLYRGLIARTQGDEETFVYEIGRARQMGELTEDPSILETIDEALAPPEPDTPTQVL